MISTELKKIVDPNNESCCEHSLAHKCKEWAMNRGYGITSSIDTDGKEVKGFGGVYLQVECDNILYEAEEDTEPKAVFKACEWILEQKEIEL